MSEFAKIQVTKSHYILNVPEKQTHLFFSLITNYISILYKSKVSEVYNNELLNLIKDWNTPFWRNKSLNTFGFMD